MYSPERIFCFFTPLLFFIFYLARSFYLLGNWPDIDRRGKGVATGTSASSSGKVIFFPHPKVTLISFGRDFNRLRLLSHVGPYWPLRYLKDYLAEINLDFLCARFVRDDDLAWHKLPPFLFLLFLFVSKLVRRHEVSRSEHEG